MPTPDEVEKALRAFWRGSPDVFDRLVDEDAAGAPGTCALLALIMSPRRTGYRC